MKTLDAKRLAMHAKRKRINCHRADPLARGHGLWRVLADLDPGRDHRAGHGGLGLSTFTEMTPPPQARVAWPTPSSVPS